MESYAVVATSENLNLIDRLEAEGHSVLKLSASTWKGGFTLAEAIGGAGGVFFLDEISARSMLGASSAQDQLAELLVGAADTAVVEVLRDFGVHADVVPMRMSPLQVFSAIGDYQGSSALGRLVFIGGSSAEGQAIVDEFMDGHHPWADGVVVQSSWSEDERDMRSVALLLGGAADAIVVSGSFDVVSIENLLRRRIETLRTRFEFRAGSKDAARLLAERGILARII